MLPRGACDRRDEHRHNRILIGCREVRNRGVIAQSHRAMRDEGHIRARDGAPSSGSR